MDLFLRNQISEKMYRYIEVRRLMGATPCYTGILRFHMLDYAVLCGFGVMERLARTFQIDHRSDHQCRNSIAERETAMIRYGSTPARAS